MPVKVGNGVAENIVHSNSDLKSLNPSHMNGVAENIVHCNGDLNP